jgi:hypothetical protein
MGQRGAWAADHVASDDRAKKRKGKPKISDQRKR